MRKQFQAGRYLYMTAYNTNLGIGPEGPGVKKLRDMIHTNECRNERLDCVLTYAKPKTPLV